MTVRTFSPVETRNPITAGTKYSNTAEVQLKDLKTAFMKMIEVL